MIKKLFCMAFLGSMLCGGAQAMNDYIACLPGAHDHVCKKNCREECAAVHKKYLQHETGANWGCLPPTPCWCLCGD